MKLVKRLAHRREGVPKPEQRKMLFFRSMTLPLVLAAAISTCSMANTPATVNALPKKFVTYKDVKPCAPDKSLLQDGEKIKETRCLKDKKLILTDTSLLVIHDSNQEGAVIELTSSRTDIRSVLERGLVAWSQSDDTAYFLTKDRKLTLIPLEDMRDTITTYTLPFDVDNLKMVHFNNMLFMAPIAGEVARLTFSDGVDVATMPIKMNAKNPDFFVSDQTLFFGEKKGEKVEILKR